MKDIFIDNDCAVKHFSSPIDEHYVELINWLRFPTEESVGFLVVSNKLIAEYHRSFRNSKSPTSMPLLLALLTRQGRVLKIDNKDLKAYMQKYFTKNINKKFTSNKLDHIHIATVALSTRKIAISEDSKLRNDMNGYSVVDIEAYEHPSHVNYK